MIDWSLAQTLKNHRELWNRVADLCDEEDSFMEYAEGDDVKEEAIHDMGYADNQINFNCFCCHFAGYGRDNAAIGDRLPCKGCPIDWGFSYEYEDEPPCCVGFYGDFDDAVTRGEMAEAADYARSIANLPVNPIYLEEEEQ